MAVVNASRPPGDEPTGARTTPRTGTGELALRRDMPLVPISSIAGRALVTVVAIMTFLGSLTAGTALMIAGASQDWRQAVSQEMTIQVRPETGRDLDAEVAKAASLARAASGVAAVQPVDKSDGERMLEPWLGSGLDLADLPIPRLIVVTLQRDATFDAEALRRALAAQVAGASLDDHRVWMQRLAAMANTVVAAAAVIFVLVLAAMCLAVGFATRGAMAGNQEIVGVLHFVGAEDRFIAAEFQRHFMRLGLKGGLLGGGSAVLAFALAGLLGHWLAGTPGGDQLAALFGGFALGPLGYLVIAAIAAGVAVLTGVVSRTIVYRHLQGLA